MICCKSKEAVVTMDHDPSKTTDSPVKEQAPDYQGFVTEEKEVAQENKLNDNETVKSNEDLDNAYTSLATSKSKSVDARSAVQAASSDDISTVYEEPPKVPDGSYVMLPDAPQRGYEPYGHITYGEKDDWKSSTPYRIGTLVWYRQLKDVSGEYCKFKWYIPGVVEDYVFSESDKNEVVGYKIGIEEVAKETMDQYYLDALSRADPVHVMLRWDEKEPDCPVEGINMNASEHDGADRLSKLVEEYGLDLGFQGAKQNGEGPHMWGITLQQLQEICAHPDYEESMSMDDVVEVIIKPKTEGTGIGYSLLINKDEPIRAKVMVSHAWGENYKQFLQTLQNSGSEGPFWVCALSICQNNDIEDVTVKKQLGPDPHFGPFATVLKQADAMIAIMTKSCDIYTRLWCVYEIFTAISLNIPVKLETYNEITGLGGSDKMYSNVVLDSTGTPISTKTAQCRYDADMKMIHNEILKKEGGFELIDDVVMWVRIKALIDEMPKCVIDSAVETQMYRNIGSCSASNIVARQNAGIANAIRVWQDAKKARAQEKVDRTRSILSMMSIKEYFSSDPEKEKELSQNMSQEQPVSFFALVRDKLCGGYF